jgi:hypothetical protein
MLYAQTVKEFVQDSYQLISASSPIVPLHGNDMSKAVYLFNRLLKSYSSSSLLLTIAKKITYQVTVGQEFVTFADPTFTPAADVQEGRLTNNIQSWLNLDGVDYPLIDESRDVFFSSYKYFPQQGLPRFIIITNDLNYTTMQLYPAPSQTYTLWTYGKFELSYIGENDTLSGLPDYATLFYQYALARQLAFYKGRSKAWDEKLEAMYTELKDNMESVSTVNLLINTANESYLNGSWRVLAGV